MLVCSDSSYYVGHTDDLEARVVAHEAGAFPGYTRTRRPVVLVWQEELGTRDEAFQRERQIKGWSRATKEALTRGEWTSLPSLATARGSTGSPRAGGAHHEWGWRSLRAEVRTTTVNPVVDAAPRA